MRGLQCQKSLYLYKNFFSMRDAVSGRQQAIFDRGTNVGLLARKLFPGGVDVSPSSPLKYRESVERTQQEISKGTQVIYEAAFQFDQVLAAIDILVKENGVWNAYEVKSSARISSAYMLDASLQYHIINNSGITLNDILIVHINNQYVKNGPIELEKLFAKVSVRAEAIGNAGMVNEKINLSKKMLTGNTVPDIKIGEHCFYPYPCDFSGTCWKEIPENSVFEISGLNRKGQFELHDQGIIRMEEIPADHPVREKANTQIECQVNNRVYIEKSGLKKFIGTLNYPLYFLDFETFMPAVPVYDGTHAFQHIPFQYSLHRIDREGGEFFHSEFLGEADKDTRHNLIEKLLKETVGKGSIIVFNASFERMVLNDLKKLFPELGPLIEERVSRIKDLMVPFLERMYLHPKMHGSNSIKNVLPALVPDLNYEKLKIGDGTVAMASFENLLTETDIYKIAETRDALLEYCRMDTLAMVKILEVLQRAAT